MHRTETQDYGFVISGELELELEKERKVLKAGDFFVQRGTIHVRPLFTPFARLNPHSSHCHTEMAQPFR